MKNESIYTLAQERTNKSGQMPIIVAGNGSAFEPESLQTKARRKLITQNLALKLIDVAKEKGELEKLPELWNAYHCQDRLISTDERYYGNYCKSRYCAVCCGIRKASMILRYHPIIQTWENGYFVTLTLKSVKAKQLSAVMDSMYNVFDLIIDKHRKRYSRGNGIKLIGVKSLECNFNPVKGTYNPHFHFIVKNKATAEVLRNEWLARAKKDWTVPQAQHMEKLYSVEKGLIEVIKYGTKIFTEPDLKVKKSGNAQIYVAAIDVIYSAMKGRRLFDKFGFDVPKQQKEKTEVQILKDYAILEHDPKQLDWVDTMTGKAVSGFETPHALDALLSNSCNTTLS